MAGKADDRGANNAPAQPRSPPCPTSPKVDRDQCDKTREASQSRDHDHDSHSRYDKTGVSSPTTRDSDDDQPGQPPRKRQRVRLSCLECRRRVRRVPFRSACNCLHTLCVLFLIFTCSATHRSLTISKEAELRSVDAMRAVHQIWNS